MGLPQLKIKKIKKLSLPKVARKQVLVGGALVFLLAFAFLSKDWFVVALVNNRPITRFSLDRDLEKQGGKQVLESRISEMLVLDEAKKQKVSLPQTEVDAKINQIKTQVESQGQKLETLLAAQGQTQKDLENQIRLQLTAEKLLSDKTQVSDQEVADYFKTNQSTYPKGTKLEEKAAEIKDQLAQQKLSAAISPWLEKLRTQAKIYYFLKL